MYQIVPLSDSLPSARLDARHYERIYWDTKTNAYRFKRNNRKLSDRQLYRMVRNEIDRYKTKHDRLVTQLIQERINLRQFQEKMIEQERKHVVNMTRLGRGGKDRTYAVHYLEAGNELRTSTYPKVKALAEQIDRGELSEKMIRHRAKFIANAGKISFEKARISNYLEDEIERVGKRHLGSCTPHCPECLQYAQLGWLPLANVIPPGVACSCRSNCCCSVEIKIYEDIY